MKQLSKLSNTKTHYKNKLVNSKTVSISSFFNHHTDKFFAQELIKKNTAIIVRPLAKIYFLKENNNSECWEEGFDYELLIKPFGLINIWGVHHINVISLNKTKTEIITIEKNNICKVWNHKLTFKKVGECQTEYTDEVTLYAGWLTPILAHFLIYSYKKRHQNWDKLLTEILGEPLTAC
jgi:hypothetical protein